jgi:hypothetical protein
VVKSVSRNSFRAETETAECALEQEAKAVYTSKVMEILSIFGVVAVWYVAVRFVLPRFGVPT